MHFWARDVQQSTAAGAWPQTPQKEFTAVLKYRCWIYGTRIVHRNTGMGRTRKGRREEGTEKEREGWQQNLLQWLMGNRRLWWLVKHSIP